MYNKTTDVTKIYLSSDERRYLKKLRHRHLALPPEMDELYRADLVEYDLLPDVDALGQYLKADTVHLTDKYTRYRNAHSLLTPEYLLSNVVVPIVIAIITSLITIFLTFWLSGVL